MPGGAIKNFAKATLTAGIAAGATSLTVGSGEGGKFPAQFPFYIIIFDAAFADPADDPAVEVLDVSNRVGDVFTHSAAANSHNTGGHAYKIYLSQVREQFIGPANSVQGTDSTGLKIEHKTLAVTGPVTLAHSVGGVTVGADTPKETTLGMLLRTHPDATAGLAKLLMDYATWITMHDGRRVVPSRRLVLDKAGSVGAIGGWQATPQLDTWNKVYYLRKSSDGSDGLFAVRGKDYFLDASMTTDATSEILRAGATDRIKLAQGFKVNTPGLIEFVDIKAKRAGSPVGQFWLSPYSDSGASPSSILQAAGIDVLSDKYDAAKLWTTAGFTRLPFRNPYSFLTATQYHLALEADYAVSATNRLDWHGNTANTYGDGVAKKYDGTSWAAATPLDFAFKLYVTRNDAALVAPPGYDLSAHVGWVYIDGAGNFKGFTARDRNVGTFQGASWKIGSFSTGNKNLQDLAAFLPPVMVDATFSFGLANVNEAFEIGRLSAIDVAGAAGVDVSGAVRRTSTAHSDSVPASGLLGPITIEYQGFNLALNVSTTPGLWLRSFSW